MDNNQQNIDNYYSDKLGNYSADKNKRVWNRLRWILLWDKYKYWLLTTLLFVTIGTGYAYFGDFSGNDPYAYKIVQSSNSVLPDDKKPTTETTFYKESLRSDDSELSVVLEEPEALYTDVETDSGITESPAPLVIPIQEQVVEQDELALDHSTQSFQSQISARVNALDLAKNNKPDIINFENILDAKTNLSKHFSFSIFAGISQTDFTYSGTNAEYLNYRNSNESPYIGWSAGTRLHFQIRRLIITTGLDYSVYNQRRSYSNTVQLYSPEDSYYDYDTTWSWVFDPPDIGVPIVSGIDSTWIKVYNDHTTKNNGINKLTYLEIPLLLGYQVNYNMISLELSAGVGFGFLLGNNFEVPSSVSDTTFVTLNDFRSTNINLLIQGKFYYHLNARASIYLSPYIKRGMNSIYNSSYPVGQNIKSYGLNFGINFRF